jgi:hypothetical protein
MPSPSHRGVAGRALRAARVGSLPRSQLQPRRHPTQGPGATEGSRSRGPLQRTDPDAGLSFGQERGPGEHSPGLRDSLASKHSVSAGRDSVGRTAGSSGRSLGSTNDPLLGNVSLTVTGAVIR